MRQAVPLVIAALAFCTLAPWGTPCAAQRFPRLQQLINQNRANGNQPNMRNLMEVWPTPDPIRKETVAKLIKPLGEAINNRPDDSPPFRIAVFPFADKVWDFEKRKETSERLSLHSIELQGAINSALRNGLKVAAPEKFVLLDSFGLQREFQRAGIDPVSISPDNKQLPDLLKELNIDAAVVGRITDPKVPDEPEPEADVVQMGSFPTRRFTASIVFAEADRPQAIVPVKLVSAQGTLLGTQKRIRLSLECRVPGAKWGEIIPIIVDRHMLSPDDLYAVIKPHQANAEYRVLVSNAGHNPREYESFLGAIINPDADREKNRVFGVAVLIDGVNSFYQDIGNGELGPVALHPSDAKKWLIGPPGYKLFADKDGKPWLQPARPDHSAVAVAGFQLGASQARAFQFAKTATLGGDKGVVAETLGISQSIGLISVFVYSQKLKGDKMFGAAAAPVGDPPALGTAAGRLFANQVFNLKIDFHPQPVLQFHINYRLRDEIPIPQENWLDLSR